MNIQIAQLMEESGIKFGTSGARGLSEMMTDRICYAYTKGFLSYLFSTGELEKGCRVAVAGDFRPSTGRIMEAVRRGICDSGLVAVNCGNIPSPAVALYGISQKIPAIMVTGSHIPADRNGIKFNKISGEVLKSDEPGITSQVVELPDDLFDANGSFTSGATEAWAEDETAATEYVKRYTSFFPSDILSGMKLGFYQHSAVGRDMIARIYSELGAEVVLLGRSEEFVPVDTEAIRPEDVELAQKWAGENDFVSILSTDGDSDRPLISDENGKWLRGDVAGILCAEYLQAKSVSVPVSCNTALEKCGKFADIRRTRIGSPFVIESMNSAVNDGFECVIGYEANGGFLLNTPYSNFGKTLPALPTRDAVILHLAILILAKEQGKTISELLAAMPQCYTASDLLREFPQENSRKILEAFGGGSEEQNKAKFTEAFSGIVGAECVGVDQTDGVRAVFANNEVVHLRPSGNAPEFRCYNEAGSEQRVKEISSGCMKVLREL